MSSPSSRTAIGAVAVLASLALALPASAAADSQYPPDPGARGFSGGLAGWTGSTGFDGSCLPPLLCPSVANSHQVSGGADGGGFVRSAYQGVAGAMAVAGTSTAVWTSPAFTYSGDGGGRPDAVSFRMDRWASVDQLLAVSGNSATYSVRLANLSEGGETISLIPPTTLAGAKDWRSVASGPVDPDRLGLGDEYRLLITSTYVTGTSALASGSADYDNVTLRAVGESGAANRKAKGKGGGGSGDSERSLLDLLWASAPATATVVAGGKRLLVRQKVRVGKRSATLIKSRKLIRRG